MSIKMKHPTFKGDGVEQTYSEIVKIKKGCCEVEREATANMLESRGYKRVEDQEPAKQASSKPASEKGKKKAGIFDRFKKKKDD